jgi:hypothetical protein
MNQFWRRSFTVIGIFAAFAVGVITSNFLKETRQFFAGDEQLRCIGKGPCIGETAAESFKRLDTDSYGLTLLICGTGESADYLFLPDIVGGKSCSGRDSYVELRNPTSEILVEIKAGKIAKITRRPLHILDT